MVSKFIQALEGACTLFYATAGEQPSWDAHTTSLSVLSKQGPPSCGSRIWALLPASGSLVGATFSFWRQPPTHSHPSRPPTVSLEASLTVETGLTVETSHRERRGPHCQLSGPVLSFGK